MPPIEKQKSKNSAQPQASVVSTSQTEHIPLTPIAAKQPLKPKLFTRVVPPYPDPLITPPPRPPDLKENQKILMNSDINTDLEENSKYQGGIISETYERLGKSYIREPPELGMLLETSKLVQKYVLKQADLDKILEIIKRKVLKGIHLTLMVKEIQAGYLTRPYFKDLHLYLAENKLPSKKSAICKVEALEEKFILLDSLLFKLVTTPDTETALLAIPEICTDKIITLYHSNLFAGYQGLIKTHLTIEDKFIIPGLMHDLHSFIKGCHICQLVRKINC